MTTDAIILMPILFSFVFLYGASKLNDEFNILKFIAYMFSFAGFFLSIWYSILYLISENKHIELQNALGTTIFILSLLFLFIIGIFLYKFIKSPTENEFKL